MFMWFKRKSNITFEDQLQELDKVGIKLIENIPQDILLQDITKDKYEEKPYILLLISLGSETYLSDGGFSHISNDIWYLDTECIEDHGDYIRIIERICELVKTDIQ
ncbi:hypothetical protein [Paenibacillus sp. OAS669]|uniref:hypothetical protein n=1 Tax=Paenibacillus sp. OAS669 TaxID=2663821 RepID=UPI00178C0517|nr:hypothetical protein [Paenibacillus sp. OAS669]MBE1441251.1 hypothetical protein [Paenibacillus sp. OAS669]